MLALGAGGALLALAHRRHGPAAMGLGAAAAERSACLVRPALLRGRRAMQRARAGRALQGAMRGAGSGASRSADVGWSRLSGSVLAVVLLGPRLGPGVGTGLFARAHGHRPGQAAGGEQQGNESEENSNHGSDSDGVRTGESVIGRECADLSRAPCSAPRMTRAGPGQEARFRAPSAWQASVRRRFSRTSARALPPAAASRWRCSCGGRARAPARSSGSWRGRAAGLRPARGGGWAPTARARPRR